MDRPKLYYNEATGRWQYSCIPSSCISIQVGTVIVNGKGKAFAILMPGQIYYLNSSFNLVADDLSDYQIETLTIRILKQEYTLEPFGQGYEIF